MKREILLTVWIISILFLQACSARQQKGLPLVVSSMELPQSLDPFSYDVTHLQPIQSALNIKLFSVFADGKTTGQLAKAWRSKLSGALWEIDIREDIRFGNGRTVKAEDVVRSLQRVAFLCKARKSSNGFIENLLGIETLETAYSRAFQGISASGNTVTFKFIKSIPNFMEIMAFGLYSIVDEANYDPKSGAWANPKMEGYSGTGPYLVEAADKNRISVTLKKNFPKELIHDHAFEKINFIEGGESEADVFEASNEFDLFSSNHKFVPFGTIGISYILLHSWKLQSSPLHSEGVRVALREEFTNFLKAESRSSLNSFFPLAMQGIREIPDGPPRSHAPVLVKKIKKISFSENRPGSKLIDATLNSLEKAIKKIGFQPEPKKIKFEKLFSNKDYDRKAFDVDIGFYSTEVEVIEPLQDVRLMFSKEGIHLPDANGEIRKELSGENFSPQRINEELFKQGLVWPIAHRKIGMWVKDRVDLSRYVALSGLSELQWMGEAER